MPSHSNVYDHIIRGIAAEYLAQYLPAVKRSVAFQEVIEALMKARLRVCQVSQCEDGCGALLTP